MDLSKEEILKKIDRLITIKADNTIANHFRYTGKSLFSWDNEDIIGQTKVDSFVLWQHNYWWGSIFYPIIYGSFSTINNKVILKLKTRLNIIGKIVNGLIILLMAYATLPACFIITRTSFKIDFSELVYSIIMIIGIQTVPFAAYWATTRNSIKFIKEYLIKEKISNTSPA
jgi:hypothetical protein